MFERFLHYNFSLFDGKKFIISCSGGMDSMVLLHILQQINCTLIVYHVDHLTRNGQSSQDRHFINQYCNLHQLEFYGDQYRHESGNFQSDSRAFRYKGLRQLLKKTKSDYITTGHHMSDNNETFFINALRGTGIKGLSGMNVIDPPLIRPLLPFRKNEIRDYALSHQVPFVHDESNDLSLYVRNIIRNEFLSRIEQLNPNIDKRVNHTIEKVRSDYYLLEELINGVKEKYITGDPERTTVSLDVLKDFSEGKVLLYHLLRPYGINIHQVEDIVSSGVGSSFDTSKYNINLDRGKLLIKQKKDQSPTNLEIPMAGSYLIHAGLYLNIMLSEFSSMSQEENHILLSVSKVTFPLRLRNWLPGDKFCPSGMQGNSKKVSKYLKDLKIPNIEKSEIFVLISNDGNICGIPGYRADHRYLPNKNDKDILVVQLVNE